MLELKNTDGTSLGYTSGGISLMHAAHAALKDYGTPDTIAMLPAATAVEGEYMLLAIMDDGHVHDSLMRLVGTPD